MKIVPILLLTIAGTLMIGCSSNAVAPVAGSGDDFPNSKTSIASALAQNTQGYTDWNQFGQVPDSQTTDLTAADSLVGAASTVHAVLAKTSATQATDSIAWDKTDSAQGYVFLYRVHDDLFSLTSEKRAVVWNAAAKDSILGNETVLAIAGTVENKLSKAILEYNLFDTDKNGYLDSGFIRYTQPVLGVYYQTSVWATSGNDNNFTQHAKRRINRVLNLQILGSDTLQLVDIRDADGDSAIFRRGGANRVNAVIQNRSLYPILTNQRALSTINCNATLHPADSSRWEVNLFHCTNLFTDGHIEAATICGDGSDSLLTPNDTAIVRFDRASAPAADYDSAMTLFKVKLGATVNDVAHHALLSYVIQGVNNHLNVRYVSLSFVSDSPLYASTPSDSVSGTLRAEVRFADGTSGSLTAVLADDVFDVTYVSPKGDVVRFKCDKAGNVLN